MAESDKDKTSAGEKEPPATAAETAAAQAVKASQQKGMTKEEIRAQETTRAQEKQSEETARALEENRREDNEMHQVSDLMAASSRLYGVAPEVVAGACHHAGLEMTQEVTAGDLQAHIRSFLDQPA